MSGRQLRGARACGCCGRGDKMWAGSKGPWVAAAKVGWASAGDVACELQALASGELCFASLFKSNTLWIKHYWLVLVDVRCAELASEVQGRQGDAV